jgi:hypothetical protein
MSVCPVTLSDADNPRNAAPNAISGSVLQFSIVRFTVATGVVGMCVERQARQAHVGGRGTSVSFLSVFLLQRAAPRVPVTRLL